MLPVLAGGHYTLAQPKGWRKIDPAGLRRRHYQGWPFKSGTLGDGSGNPPDIRINAATNSPAHPPPQNDTNSHQAETIRLPPSCRWSRLPGSPKRPSHASILRLGRPKPLCVRSSPPHDYKKVRPRPDLFSRAVAPLPTRSGSTKPTLRQAGSAGCIQQE